MSEEKYYYFINNLLKDRNFVMLNPINIKYYVYNSKQVDIFRNNNGTVYNNFIKTKKLI